MIVEMNKSKPMGLKLTLFSIGSLLLILYKNPDFRKLNLLRTRHFPRHGDKNFNLRCTGDDEQISGVAESVHRLRAHDVGVVVAIGDSITAANGAHAQNMEECTIEHPGLSWSIGGDSSIHTLVTLPNLLRKFRPNVTGFSTTENPHANFNMAIPGQRAYDLLIYQVDPLIEKIKANASLYANEWKIITLQIGTCDLCRFCGSQWETDLSNATSFVSHVKQVLDTLASNLPRTFVNLVGPMYIVSRANESGLEDCYQRRAERCKCEHDPRYSQLFNEYHEGLERLAMSAEYTEREDFTVVFQPFAKEFGKRPLISRNKANEKSIVNKSELVTYDCLHLSSHGNSKRNSLDLLICCLQHLIILVQ